MRAQLSVLPREGVEAVHALAATLSYFSWGLWASKLSVSASLERFGCRQPFLKTETFIHLGVPFLPNFKYFVRGGKKSQPNSSCKVRTQHNSLGSVLGFTEKIQKGRKPPTISQLLRKAGEHCRDHEARQAVGTEVLKSVSLDFCFWD